MAGSLTPAAGSSLAVPALASGATVAGLATDQWLTIAAGLTIGMIARWAMLLANNKPLDRRVILVDCLMFLANGVLAAQVVADVMNISGIKLLTAAMMFGAGSTIVFSSMWRRWFTETTGAPPPADVIPPDTAAEVKQAGPRTQVMVEALCEEDSPRARVGQNLRRANARAAKPLTRAERRLLAQLEARERGAESPSEEEP